MGATTTSSGEQIDNMQEAIGFDGYNGDVTGDKEATLGVNCGFTTGRNGVLVRKVIGVDLYNQSLTGSVSKTLSRSATDSDHVPVVLIEAEKPVYTLKIRGGREGGGKGALIQTDLSATLGTNQDQYMFVPTRGAKVLFSR